MVYKELPPSSSASVLSLLPSSFFFPPSDLFCLLSCFCLLSSFFLFPFSLFLLSSFFVFLTLSFLLSSLSLLPRLNIYYTFHSTSSFNHVSHLISFILNRLMFFSILSGTLKMEFPILFRMRAPARTQKERCCERPPKRIPHLKLDCYSMA